MAKTDQKDPTEFFNVCGLFDKTNDQGDDRLEGTPYTKNTKEEYVKAAQTWAEAFAKEPGEWVFMICESKFDNGPKFNLVARKKRYSQGNSPKGGKGAGLSRFKRG